MSISSELMQAYPTEIMLINVNKEGRLHGELATEVKVILTNGKTVEGGFTSQPRSGFGGVEFDQHKDIVALMSAKIDSVLRGTHEKG
jgi:hypothetical protein